MVFGFVRSFYSLNEVAAAAAAAVQIQKCRRINLVDDDDVGTVDRVKFRFSDAVGSLAARLQRWLAGWLVATTR